MVETCPLWSESELACNPNDSLPAAELLTEHDARALLTISCMAWTKQKQFVTTRGKNDADDILLALHAWARNRKFGRNVATELQI